jgi:hypothetical protein
MINDPLPLTSPYIRVTMYKKRGKERERERKKQAKERRNKNNDGKNST